MAKTIILRCKVQLSEKFGGIEHGEKPGVYDKGSTLELKSDALADCLIKKGYAAESPVLKK